VGLYGSCVDRPDRRLLCVSGGLTVACARASVWTMTCAAAAAAALLPCWMLAAPVALGPLLGVAQLAFRARGGRVRRTLAASIAPACRPRLLVWASVAAAARIAAAAEVLVPLGVVRPVRAAVIGLAALAAATTLPVAAGGAAAAGTGHGPGPPGPMGPHGAAR